jgi:hypothetical protein
MKTVANLKTHDMIIAKLDTRRISYKSIAVHRAAATPFRRSIAQ